MPQTYHVKRKYNGKKNKKSNGKQPKPKPKPKSKQDDPNLSRKEYTTKLVKTIKKFNEGKIEDVKIDLTKISIKYVLHIINHEIPNAKLGFKLDDGSMYFLNDKTKNDLEKGNIEDDHLPDGNRKDNDYQEMVNIHTKTRNITLFKIEAEKTRKGGGFFKYLNNTHFDLSRYGVYQEVNKYNYDENCLYIAFKNGGMSDVKLESLKLCVMNRVIPKCKLKEVCEKLEIAIKLNSIRSDGVTSVEHYGDKKCEERYEIGLMEEHYFIIEKTDITSYCLNNYNDVKEIANCNNIVAKTSSGKYSRQNKRGIDSLNVFKIMLENKDVLLKPLYLTNELMNTQFYDRGHEYKTLEYSKRNIEYKKWEPKEAKEYYKVYFDFETITNNKNHEPYLVRYETQDNERREFIGKDCAIKMLDNLPRYKNIMLIAHNANYDCRFLLKYLEKQNPLVKGNRILSCNAHFNRYGDPKQKINIIIKDSIKIINMPLSSFGKSFNLDVEKEIMPYQIYTRENIYNKSNPGFVSLSDAIVHLKDCDIDRFKNNISKWGCWSDDGQSFDIIKYSSKYCEMDCHVLRKGYEKFREWMFEYTGLDIDHYITIQSLCSAFKLKEGCYDGVAMLSGVVQDYISQCIVGGRCMTNSNKMYHVKGKLADFDACSLYPSAMARMKGYLKGAPKVLKNLTYDFIKEQDGYFIRICIKKVGKDRQFPLNSKYADNGVRVFSNDMVGEVIFIDKCALEDAIEFQGIEFEVIDGYYCNEGHNDTINRVIRHLYDKRRELKKQGNPAQIVIKELMNSMYGKTILKPIQFETVVVPEERFESYISYNYNYIYSSVRVEDRYYVKKIKSILEHFNYCHIGVEILSMSKRIMNEVMCLAEDEGLSIYYQDTDSMHIKYDEVAILSTKFKEKYGRELIGNDMGQFHIDFEMEGAKGEIYGIEGLFLGKKIYIDKLESVDENKSTIQDYHDRLKGIPNSCIRYLCKTLKDGDKLKYNDIFELYKDLYDGGKVSFDLTEGGKNCGFRYEKNMSVRSYIAGEFDRCISMPKDVERITINLDGK